eukprot:5629936-Amphidinium_carterae.1
MGIIRCASGLKANTGFKDTPSERTTRCGCPPGGHLLMVREISSFSETHILVWLPAWSAGWTSAHDERRVQRKPCCLWDSSSVVNTRLVVFSELEHLGLLAADSTQTSSFSLDLREACSSVGRNYLTCSGKRAARLLCKGLEKGGWFGHLRLKRWPAIEVARPTCRSSQRLPFGFGLKSVWLPAEGRHVHNCPWSSLGEEKALSNGWLSSLQDL